MKIRKPMIFPIKSLNSFHIWRSMSLQISLQKKAHIKNFKGSMWSKGFVPVDTLAILENRTWWPMPL